MDVEDELQDVLERESKTHDLNMNLEKCIGLQEEVLGVGGRKLVENDLFDHYLHTKPSPPEAVVMINILKEYVHKVDEMLKAVEKAKELGEYKKLLPKIPLQVFSTLGAKNFPIGEDSLSGNRSEDACGHP